MGRRGTVWADPGRVYGRSGGDAPVAQVDIFDDAGDAPTAVYPATLTLTWEGRRLHGYFPDRTMGRADWNVVAQGPRDQRQDGKLGESPMADGETHTFRVVPVDAKPVTGFLGSSAA